MNLLKAGNSQDQTSENLIKILIKVLCKALGKLKNIETLSNGISWFHLVFHNYHFFQIYFQGTVRTIIYNCVRLIYHS